MFQDISITEWMEKQRKTPMELIDVRSPSEFAETTIPGSRNIPLFDDAERAEIGTLYKQYSVQEAKERGLEIVSAKLPAFVKSFSEIPGEKIVYCWRGGMRSKTTATVLSLMGIHVYRLAGGIREYRRWVVEQLEHYELKAQPYVINGHTGTGKTWILQRLQERGYPVLDLETMAGHRGSVFGSIGMDSRNQKQFDALLLHALHKIEGQPYVLMEAESRRIGKVTLPPFLLEKKEGGIPFFIRLPVEERVRYILEEYRPWEHREEVLEAYDRIRTRIHTPLAKEIAEHLEGGRYAEAVGLLLVHYYDPRYEYAASQYGIEPVPVHARNREEALKIIVSRLPEIHREPTTSSS